jgi:ABC-2 type transport system permease protein
MNKHFFSDMGVMLGRSMRHIFRSMDTIITVTIMPIAIMLLFVYVFGGAIQTGTDNYVNYLLPGILLIAIASGISYTAYRLFMDMQRGIFERFHSMPIARSTVLWGHVLTSLVSNAISVVVIILVALIMGFRSSAGVLSWLAVAGILALFTLALTWIAAIAGLSAKSVDGASAFSYPIIFLPFISSAFVPTASMPGPVRAFAENQPVTSIVDAIRSLLVGVSLSATSFGLRSRGAWLKWCIIIVLSCSMWPIIFAMMGLLYLKGIKSAGNAGSRTNGGSARFAHFGSIRCSGRVDPGGSGRIRRPGACGSHRSGLHLFH